jgi:RNA polymerase sigma factor (sigma-70 family)
MNPEEQQFEKFSYLIPITLHKMFQNPSKLAISNHLSYDDLIQYGRIGLLDAIRSYPEKGKGKLKEQSYMIRNIRWAIGCHISREALNQSIYKNTYNKKRNLNKKINLISMSMNPYNDMDDDATYYDIVSTDNYSQHPESVESIVHSQIGYNKMLNVLTDKEKEMVLMKMNENLSYQEIGQRLGISKQYVGKLFRGMQDKINRHMGVATV